MENSSVFFSLGHKLVRYELHDNLKIISHADTSCIQIHALTVLRVGPRLPLRVRATSRPANY